MTIMKLTANAELSTDQKSMVTGCLWFGVVGRSVSQWWKGGQGRSHSILLCLKWGFTPYLLLLTWGGGHPFFSGMKMRGSSRQFSRTWFHFTNSLPRQFLVNPLVILSHEHQIIYAVRYVEDVYILTSCKNISIVHIASNAIQCC